MRSDNWPLMIFTLAMQFSVGVVVLYDLFLIFPITRKKEKLRLHVQMILVVALIAAFAGILFSLLHLGSPGNAVSRVAP